MFDGQSHGRIRLVGLLAGQHFVQDDAQRVDVRAAVHIRPQRLFGRHVGGRTDDGAAGHVGRFGLRQFGNAEIGNIGNVLVVEQDIAGLQVAVNDAFGMSLIHPRRDLPQQAHGFLHTIHPLANAL